MKTTGISKLKAKLSEHIAMVKRGEEVVVTERGKPVARIVPVPPATVQGDRLRELIARGVIRSGHERLGRRVSQLPVCKLPEGTVLQTLDEERRESA